MARFALTDAEWALIEPHLPVAATGPLPRRVRERFNGILWQFRTGPGWRDVPKWYGPWSTVYSRFDAWAKAGVFQTLVDALIAEAASRGEIGLELVSVDSTIVQAHHESAGLAIAGETLDALKQALTEEKGAPLPTQRSVLRVVRRKQRRTPPTRARLPVGTVPPSGGGGRRGLRRPSSTGSESPARPAATAPVRARWPRTRRTPARPTGP
uniref:transposase n=1 Tax=Actinosynnema sp. TaxID=1872144 RepID=UPI003F861828